jgi:hypothetical protein
MMMNDPEVLYITYNMNYFIEKAKQECYRLKYKEDDIDCAYDNLNQIFDTIIRCVRDNQEHYSDILGFAEINSASSDYSFRKFIEMNSSSKFIKLMHHYELYDEFCKILPKYENNYYPAITLVDILMRGVCALLDKYPTIIEINIIAGNYTNMAFTATRRENDKYNFKLSVTKLGSDTTGVIKLKE